MNKPTFNLTLGQCRDIINSGYDLRDCVSDLNDQPDWLLAMGGIEDFAELFAIYHGGCASGAFMPAVTYYKALEVMNEHGGDIMEFIEDAYGCTEYPAGLTWGGLAVHFVSLAVELWVSGVVDSFDLFSTISDY